MRKPRPILPAIRPKTRQLFAAKLQPIGDCLIFTGTKNKAGYGFVDMMTDGNRSPALAHRLAWVLEHGVEIPDDRIVCHRCNNPSCCKPEHLYLGTAKTNAADMMAAGTHKAMLKGVKGQAHPASDFTDADRARAVRLRSMGMPFAEIAQRIGCRADTVSRWWRDHIKTRQG